MNPLALLFVLFKTPLTPLFALAFGFAGWGAGLLLDSPLAGMAAGAVTGVAWLAHATATHNGPDTHYQPTHNEGSEL
jgi:hypothetical protein